MIPGEGVTAHPACRHRRSPLCNRRRGRTSLQRAYARFACDTPEAGSARPSGAARSSMRVECLLDRDWVEGPPTAPATGMGTATSDTRTQSPVQISASASSLTFAEHDCCTQRAGCEAAGKSRRSRSAGFGAQVSVSGGAISLTSDEVCPASAMRASVGLRVLLRGRPGPPTGAVGGPINPIALK